jgi:tetratricopeptide (TPR) repeat protein
MAPTPPAAPLDSGPASCPVPAAPPGKRAPGALRPLLALMGAARRRPRRALIVVFLLALIAFGLGLGGAQLWAASHFRAARRALAAYHVGEAGDHLKDCLKVWPDDPDVLFLAARAARCGGLFDPADEFLTRYQDLRGRDDGVVLERALLTAERGNVDDVLKFCKAQVEANHPATPLILEAVARGCLRTDTYRLADADWAVKTWLGREPDNPMALLLSGRLDHERYADAASAAAFRRVLEIDPEMDEARDRLTLLLLEINQPAEAVPHLEYLRRRRPGDPGFAVRLAKCQHLMGKEDEATSLLDDVIAHQPDFTPALAARGKMALEAGDYERAEPLLRRAHEHSRGDVSLLDQLRKCLDQSGKADEAREVQAELAQVKADVERLDLLVTQDIQKNPNNIDAQYEAGTILLRIGNYDEGVRRLEVVTRLAPRHVKAHEALADFYRRVGESLKAAKHERQAREASEAN